MSNKAKAVLLFVLAWGATMAFFAAMAWILNRAPSSWAFFGVMASAVTWGAVVTPTIITGLNILERRQ